MCLTLYWYCPLVPTSSPCREFTGLPLPPTPPPQGFLVGDSITVADLAVYQVGYA